MDYRTWNVDRGPLLVKRAPAVLPVLVEDAGGREGPDRNAPKCFKERYTLARSQIYSTKTNSAMIPTPSTIEVNCPTDTDILTSC